MCGICGFLSRRQINLEQLQKMNDTMIHRGPNDHGEEIYGLRDQFALGMAQRRLSIQDLSPLGHQPMHSKDDRIILVFNGEIYNFHELREELADYTFTSNCDTEVIIAAYLKWGINCISHMNGMFAIALYDRESETMYLVRDRVGKKPLYYMLDGDNIVFGSELKPIMACPEFKEEINTSVLSRFLYQQYINSPLSIFENVYKMEPGSILEYHYGQIKTYKYWDVATVYQDKKSHIVTENYQEAKELLKQELTEATRKRMIADVPLGSFLSGGYDSSLITAIAQSISEEPVKTYSIGFHEEKYNEARFAKAVAEHLGTKHTEMYIDESDMFKLVDSIPKYYDEPFADSSQIATMLVSQVAASDVTVVLSGDGGDEFFCGYNQYDTVALAQKINWMGAMTHGVCNVPGIRNLRLEKKLPYSVRTVSANRDLRTKTQFGGENYIAIAEKLVLGEHLSGKFEIEDKYQESNWQIKRMLLDMETYLPDDILCKVDRASMKYSMEARCPILDQNVIELSFALPHRFKFSQGVKKKILKDIAYDYIPRELLDRPKVGFGVPLDQWLRGPLKEQLIEMSDTNALKNQNIFNPEETHSFIMNYLKNGDAGPATGANFSKVIWPYFVFQQWYQYYIKG